MAATETPNAVTTPVTPFQSLIASSPIAPGPYEPHRAGPAVVALAEIDNSAIGLGLILVSTDNTDDVPCLRL